MAKAAVKPNELMKRPTMPPMKPTGRKTASRRERGGHHREADFLGALDGRLEGRHVLLFDEAVDIFEHDDGVVDHDADHQRQRQHGDLVQREAHGGHQREGGDDGGGNGDGRDQRGADVGQEEEDDDGGEEAAFDQVALDVIDGGLDEDRLIADHLGLDIRRQACGRFPARRCFDLVGGGDGVHAGLLGDDQGHGRLAIEAGGGARLLVAVLGVADVRTLTT